MAHSPEEKPATVQKRPTHRVQVKADLAENNPCAEEMQMTYRCLDANQYDQQRCVKYHENYKKCRRFWDDVYRDRRRNGIIPTMPAKEDRKVVEDHYRNLWYK